MVTKEQIIRYIGREAASNRKYGVKNLPAEGELCTRYPEHQSTILTAYRLLKTINRGCYETSMPSAVPLRDLAADAERIHVQFVRDMPPFFGLPADPLKPLPIRFEDIPERGLFSFEKKGLEIVLSPKPSTWPSYLDFLFTVAHESAHYLHHTSSPDFYDKVPYYGRESNIFLQVIGQSYKPMIYREFIADAAAFDFFRKTGRLSRFLEEEKSRSIPRFLYHNYSWGAPAAHRTLINLALYKEFFLTGRLSELARLKNIEDSSCLELFDSERKRITILFGEDCLVGAWHAYHFDISANSFTKDEEPTLFDT